jgi:hypothetical protein
MKYSKTTGCFYPEDIFYSTLPEDLIDVTAEEYESAMSRPPNTVLDVQDGKLVLVTVELPPPPSPSPKWVGVEFQGVMCSATAEDQNGLLAVLFASQMQGAAFAPTEFTFANGSKLIITKENIQTFTNVWMPFRQSFFVPTPTTPTTP